MAETAAADGEEKSRETETIPISGSRTRFRSGTTRRLIGILEAPPKQYENEDGTRFWRMAIIDQNRVRHAVETPIGPGTLAINGDTKVGSTIDMMGTWSTKSVPTDQKAIEIPVFSPSHASMRDNDGSVAAQFNAALDRMISRGPFAGSPVITAENPVKDTRGPGYDPVPTIETVLKAEEKSETRKDERATPHEADVNPAAPKPSDDLPFRLHPEDFGLPPGQWRTSEGAGQDSHAGPDIESGPHPSPGPHEGFPSEGKGSRHGVADEHTIVQNTYLIRGKILSKPVQSEGNPSIWTFTASQDHMPRRPAHVSVNLDKTTLEPHEKAAFADIDVGDSVAMVGSWRRGKDGNFAFLPDAIHSDATIRSWQNRPGKGPADLPEANTETTASRKTRQRHNDAGL